MSLFQSKILDMDMLGQSGSINELIKECLRSNIYPVMTYHLNVLSPYTDYIYQDLIAEGINNYALDWFYLKLVSNNNVKTIKKIEKAYEFIKLNYEPANEVICVYIRGYYKNDIEVQRFVAEYIEDFSEEVWNDIKNYVPVTLHISRKILLRLAKLENAILYSPDGQMAKEAAERFKERCLAEGS